MTDLIRRGDAMQACQVGPSDEWSRDTKSGYNQAATDCAMNILRVPAVQSAARIEALTAEVNEAQKEHKGWQSAAVKLMEQVTALTAERDEYKRLALIADTVARECKIHEARAEAAEADNARLREVVAPLIVIALDNLDGMDAETREECERDIAKARAALNTGKEPK